MFEPLESDDASFGMTLDEAIQHCEEVAKKNEEESVLWDIDDNLSDMFQENLNKCRQCGMEHRQLANWLEQLKQYRIAIQRIKEDIELQHSNTGSADSAFGRNCMIKKALAIIDKNMEPIAQLENQFKSE